MGALRIQRKARPSPDTAVNWNRAATAAITAATKCMHFNVLADETLIYLARRQPQSLEDLDQIRGLNRHRDGARIIEEIRRGLAVPDDACPHRPPRRRFDEDLIERKLAESMQHLRQQSDEAQIDAPFVAARAEVRKLVLNAAEATPENHRLLRGWRRELVGSELHEIALRAE